MSDAELPPSMPPHLAPWKDFVDGLGMGSFNPSEMFPGAPALGLSREYQETARRLVELGQQFHQRYTEFAQQNATVMQDAFHVMKKRVDLPPKSPAELYDAWIDCAEDAYHQAAHSDSFARLLADLCNISSAMKVERGKLTEQLARHLDLPSRAEVDSLHRQVRALTAALHRPAPAAAPAPAKPAKSAKAARTARPTQNPRAVRTPRKRAKK
jgi:class III poly(R)-hydroxyalkanoic acid synthase PhaE subunit